uniref:Uncharacterized protein n=1 Tax=Percolomonas cosmopolitus TaxID=63605 RepID=A0A7S1PGC4_9EUKA|mmetsp:Transcript_5603/g.21083  ORF Transcript_5603/g.21083 Transcript_5603/m.21083 type:complete len:209 (+) Transcript_5603:3-629(+)
MLSTLDPEQHNPLHHHSPEMSCILPPLSIATTQRNNAPQIDESCRKRKHFEYSSQPTKLPSLFIRRHSQKQPKTHPLTERPVRKCISDRGNLTSEKHLLKKKRVSPLNPEHISKRKTPLPSLLDSRNERRRRSEDSANLLESLQLAKELQTFSFGEQIPDPEAKPYTVRDQIKDLKMLAKRDKHLAMLVSLTSPHKLSENQMDKLGLL